MKLYIINAQEQYLTCQFYIYESSNTGNRLLIGRTIHLTTPLFYHWYKTGLLLLKSFLRMRKFQCVYSSLKSEKACLGLASLFNGISTFVCYLMPKSPLYKKSNSAIKSLAVEIRGIIPFSRVPKSSPQKKTAITLRKLGGWDVHTLPEGISPKVRIIARLEFEFVY